MKHLTGEELVERFYGEGAGDAGSHLEECEECAAALAALESDLAGLRPAEVPERDAYYGEQMWARVEASLPPRATQKALAGRFAWFRRMGYAGGCAVLVLAAFYLGRMWEQRHTAETIAHRAPAPAAQPKVVVVVLGDHLDRSERLLVELKHTDRDSDRAELAPLQDEARGLLAANHIFREDAVKQGDAALSETLNHLDGLLTEIATRPDGLDAAEVARIREEMNAEGVLFEVRVLRSKNPHRTAAVRLIAKGGAA